MVLIKYLYFVQVFNFTSLTFSVREDLITNPSPQCPVVFDYKVFSFSLYVSM